MSPTKADRVRDLLTALSKETPPVTMSMRNGYRLVDVPRDRWARYGRPRKANSVRARALLLDSKVKAKDVALMLNIDVSTVYKKRKGMGYHEVSKVL